MSYFVQSSDIGCDELAVSFHQFVVPVAVAVLYRPCMHALAAWKFLFSFHLASINLRVEGRSVPCVPTKTPILLQLWFSTPHFAPPLCGEWSLQPPAVPIQTNTNYPMTMTCIEVNGRFTALPLVYLFSFLSFCPFRWLHLAHNG